MEIETTFKLPRKSGILYAVEKCSGSGDCRKSSLIGGTNVPTFHLATGDEDKATGAGQTYFAIFLTSSEDRKKIHSTTKRYIRSWILHFIKACKSDAVKRGYEAFKAEFPAALL